MRLFLKNKSAKDDTEFPMAAKAAGLKVHFGLLDTSSGPIGLTIPPGYFAFYSPQNNRHVSGIRKTYFCKGQHTKENYEAAVKSSVTHRAAMLLLA